MFQILIGSLLLSVTHALIPNHWFPLAAVSKTENWSRGETAAVTAITGFLHTLSTIIIGIIIGFAGFKLGDEIELVSGLYAPVILILLGAYFIIRSEGIIFAGGEACSQSCGDACGAAHHGHSGRYRGCISYLPGCVFGFRP